MRKNILVCLAFLLIIVIIGCRAQEHAQCYNFNLSEDRQKNIDMGVDDLLSFLENKIITFQINKTVNFDYYDSPKICDYAYNYEITIPLTDKINNLIIELGYRKTHNLDKNRYSVYLSGNLSGNNIKTGDPYLLHLLLTKKQNEKLKKIISELLSSTDNFVSSQSGLVYNYEYKVLGKDYKYKVDNTAMAQWRHRYLSDFQNEELLLPEKQFKIINLADESINRLIGLLEQKSINYGIIVRGINTFGGKTEITNALIEIYHNKYFPMKFIMQRYDPLELPMLTSIIELEITEMDYSLRDNLSKEQIERITRLIDKEGTERVGLVYENQNGNNLLIEEWVESLLVK